MRELYSLKFRDIRAYVGTQGLLFWLVNIYLFFEYVRPQTIYPSIAILPYAQIIIISAFVLLFLNDRIHMLAHPGAVLMGLFFFVILLSSFFALRPSLSFEMLHIYLAWLLVYLLIVNVIDTEERFLIFLLAFLLYSFKMSQFSFRNWLAAGFGFSDWGTGGGPGWFHNSGEFGIQMCIFLPLSFYFVIALKHHWPLWKKTLFYLFPLTALTGTISSSSRGALVGAGAVMLWMTFKSKHKMKGVIVFFLVALLGVAMIPAEQMARLEEAGEDNTSRARLERWDKGVELANRYPLLGVGYKNWPVADRLIFQGRGGLPHNIFVECMSELGYTGLIVFFIMIFYTLHSNRKTRQWVTRNDDVTNKFIFYTAHGLDGALIGFLVSGFFVTVLYYPYFWINLSMTVALNNIARKEAAGENDRPVFG